MSIADTICATLALPDEFPPLRISDTYSCTKTAVTKVNQDIAISWPGAGGGANCPGADSLVFLFRDPLRWLVVFDHNVAGNTSEYQWAANGQLQIFTIYATITNQINVSGAVPTTAPISDWQPHGGMIFAGSGGNQRYMWVDIGYKIIASVILGANDAGVMNVYQWNHNCKQFVTAVAGTANGAELSYTAALAGYYTVEFVWPTEHICTIKTRDDVGLPSFRHIAVPDIVRNLNRIQAYSMTASSILWRNTASYDNAQGDIGAVLIGPGNDWWQIARSGQGYNGLSENFSNGWKSFFAAKGVYAWLKPSDEEDLEFQTNIRTSVPGDLSTWTYAAFSLQSRIPYMAAAISVTNDAGRDTLLRAAAHIQYQSNDSWADVREPAANVDDWLQAVKMLTYVPDITENPLHIKDVLGAIGKVGLVMNSVQQRLAPAVSAVAGLIPGGATIAQLGTASLPYQRKAWQYLADMGAKSGSRENVDPRQQS